MIASVLEIVYLRASVGVTFCFRLSGNNSFRHIRTHVKLKNWKLRNKNWRMGNITKRRVLLVSVVQ